jgi:enamine deaminase RidA (YjgF/YER057c/UK114 family)
MYHLLSLRLYTDILPRPTEFYESKYTMQRKSFSTGTKWEKEIGYSRALRVGKFVFVSGTTATNSEGKVEGVNDPYVQSKFILEKIKAALHEVGAELKDVVRTRMYLTNITHWQEVGKAHGEFFSGIDPATAIMEISKLISPEHLVEIEVDAILE